MPCRAVAIYFGSAARLNREQLKRLVKRTNTLGRYRTEVTPDMRGAWTASPSFDTPQDRSDRPAVEVMT